MSPRWVAVTIGPLVVATLALPLAAQHPPTIPHLVLFSDSTPFAAFRPAVEDDRERDNPAAWAYLDRRVLGTVQTLEAQFGVHADHVYSAALRGFAARLTPTQVEELRRLPFVAAIEPDLIWPAGTAEADHVLALESAHRYVITARPPLALEGSDRVNVADAQCAPVPRTPHATVTFVNVGACRPSPLYTSAVIKGVDWVTANASKPASVRMQTGAPSDPTLRVALRRSGESGLTYAGIADRPVRSPIARGLRISEAALAAGPGAALYNLKIVSDGSPDLTDVRSLVDSTTSLWPSNAEKVWALFYWGHILKRQTAPMVRHGSEVLDPIRNFADYGFTMCSTISGINQTLFEVLGLRHEYWDICNHTVSQVEYDGKFRVIDSSMSNLVTTDGVQLASLQEAAANSARLVRESSLYATSPNGFLTGSDTLRNLSDFISPANGSRLDGFGDAFCESNLHFRDYYYNWDSGHRYVLNLRENESYTRYYRRLGTTPDYWVGSENVTTPDPSRTAEIDSANRFGIRGNGRWAFAPSLAAGTYARAVYKSSNLAPAAAGGLTAAVPGEADVIYKVQAANAITSQHIQARFAVLDAQANATIAVSLNHGETWADVAALAGSTGTDLPLAVSLRDVVMGTYETLVRVQMNVPSASPQSIRLTSLTIETLTQVNTKALPALKVGRNEIFVGVGERSDTMVLWPELRGELWRNDAYDSSNIASQPVSVPRRYTAVIFPAVLTQDAYLTYRMDAPSDVTAFSYGGRLHNYSAGSYIDFLHSLDGGATWVRSYRHTDVTKPYDVIHYETIRNVPPGIRTVMFKFLFHNTNTSATRATGLYSARMEVNHEPVAEALPLEVTWRWKELRADRSLVERSHKQRIATFPFRYVVNVGGSDHPVMESIAVNLEGSGDTAPLGYGDGIDVGGEKHVPRKQTVGTNLAAGAAYAFSRPPSGFQSSAGESNATVLTDGVVGSPLTGGVSYWWGQCWSSGSPVDLQIDLGSLRTARAFRAHLFGYPFWDALKGQVQDRVEVLTSSDGATFVSRGVLQTSLWKKDIPINHMLQDDERATGWNFELATAPVSVRYVTYRMTPRRDLCVSELQVLDRLDYEPFDLRIALPDSASIPDTQAPTAVLTSPLSATTVSGVVAMTAAAADNVGVTRVDFLVNGVAVASDSSSPYAATWDSRGVADGSATLTAAAADAAGNIGTSPPVSITVMNAPPTGAPDIVLYASRATVVAGAWQVEPSTSAAGGSLIRHPNAGVPRSSAPLASPVNYFELTFRAEANVPYHLWLRGKADSNNWANDSVWVQFSNVSAYPIGTTNAATVTLEDCINCGVSGWGWQDNGFGLNVLGPPIAFTTTGMQTVRVQTREDGLAIDQIMLSPVRFFATPPGALKNDATIYPASDQPPTGPLDIVLYASRATVVAGAWQVEPSTSAAGGSLIRHPNAGVPRSSAPLASPVNYFDLTFRAEANVPYHVWLRGKADSNNWANDSVWVQFSNVSAYPIGTTNAATVTLEDCINCGVSGWGWQDNGFGLNVLGPPIAFTTTGMQTVRVQTREDGLAIDQIMLSPVRFFATPPGVLKNDTTIYPATGQQ